MRYCGNQGRQNKLFEARTHAQSETFAAYLVACADGQESMCPRRGSLRVAATHLVLFDVPTAPNLVSSSARFCAPRGNFGCAIIWRIRKKIPVRVMSRFFAHHLA